MKKLKQFVYIVLNFVKKFSSVFIEPGLLQIYMI